MTGRLALTDGSEGEGGRQQPRLNVIGLSIPLSPPLPPPLPPPFLRFLFLFFSLSAFVAAAAAVAVVIIVAAIVDEEGRDEGLGFAQERDADDARQRQGQLEPLYTLYMVCMAIHMR